MVSFDFTLQLRVRNVGYDTNRTGIRASVQRKLENSEGYIEVSQTETVYHENNVNFKHKCLLPFCFGRESSYKIVVYGVRDESGVFSGVIGKAAFSLYSTIASKGTQSFQLFPNCFLDVFISLSESYSQGICLQFEGNNLHAPDTRPLAVYITVLLCTAERHLLLYKSPIVREKHPHWPEFILPLHLLQFYTNVPIQVHCMNYNVNASDRLLGQFSTTFSQLQLGTGTLNTYMLTHPNGARLPEKTSVVLTKLEATPVPNILQLFQQNNHLSFSTAIDLTASNGNPSDPASLHFIHPYSSSQYEIAMQRLIPMMPLMNQPKIVALGFGCKIPVQFAPNQYELSHCFNLDGSPGNGFVNGFQGLIEAYRSARLNSLPFAPTEFAEVIYQISKFAKAEARNPHGLYFVLFIFTNGAPSQLRKTINAIVDASWSPLSIYCIGVGENRDFSGLQALQSPTLKHSDGRQVNRQNFLFVEASQIETDDAMSLLPLQMTSYAANKSLNPS